jgi:hypothetical protein
MDGFLFWARRRGSGEAKALLWLVAAATAFATALPAVASADFTASLSLDQSAGTTAGSSPAIGFDEKFGSTTGDAVKTVSLALPPGLLANESIAGGGCVLSSSPNAGCQVGSGTVSLAGGGSQAFAVDLVKPPNPADVAGLSFVFGTTPLATADVTLGASGAATVVSNLAPGIAETNFTFTDLRLPSSCPSPGANVTMNAVSQSGASVTATAPLTVTGCSGLPYAPTLAVSEARDAKDPGATLGLDVTQATNEAASKTIMLKLPSGIGVNVAADARCLTGANTGCVVGSATATSPLAPMQLSGTVRLAGSKSNPTVTLAFPAPFALTLVGDVNLTAGTVTINNVPDVPLTDLKLMITGPNGQKAFTTTCRPSNTTGTFTSQSGVTKVVSSKVTLTHCAASPTASGSASGLATGHPKLRLTVSQGQGAAKIASIAVGAPTGLRFARSVISTTRRCATKHGKRTCTTTLINGLGVSGAKVKTVAVKRGTLIITLKNAAKDIAVTLSGSALTETSSLQSDVKKHKVTSITATLKVTDAKHTTTLVPLNLNTH